MLEICCGKPKERKLKFLSSDRGREFSVYCKKHGIVLKKRWKEVVNSVLTAKNTSLFIKNAPYTQHQNRLAKRKI